MNWFNPMNWVRKAVASAIDAKIDEFVVPAQAKVLANNGVNYVIGMTDGTVSDDALRPVAKGLVNGGGALIALGNGIDPDGESGRKLSDAEQAEIMSKLEFATGALLTEEQCTAWRAKIKAFVHQKIGVD